MSKRPSKAPPNKPDDVDAYLAGLPEEARTMLEKFRATIRAVAPGGEEAISYQIPMYRYKGKPLIYFAAWKKHCSIYPLSEELSNELGKELERYETSGKGTIRFRLDQPYPEVFVKKLVKARMKEVGTD